MFRQYNNNLGIPGPKVLDDLPSYAKSSPPQFTPWHTDDGSRMQRFASFHPMVPSGRKIADIYHLGDLHREAQKHELVRFSGTEANLREVAGAFFAPNSAERMRAFQSALASGKFYAVGTLNPGLDNEAALLSENRVHLFALQRICRTDPDSRLRLAGFEQAKIILTAPLRSPVNKEVSPSSSELAWRSAAAGLVVHALYYESNPHTVDSLCRFLVREPQVLAIPYLVASGTGPYWSGEALAFGLLKWLGEPEVHGRNSHRAKIVEIIGSALVKPEATSLLQSELGVVSKAYSKAIFQAIEARFAGHGVKFVDSQKRPELDMGMRILSNVLGHPINRNPALIGYAEAAMKRAPRTQVAAIRKLIGDALSGVGHTPTVITSGEVREKLRELQNRSDLK